MKLYSLYEFPKSIQELDIILKYVDKYQPVEYADLLKVISEAITKTGTRTNITLKTLIKLGLIEGTKFITLSSITQIYFDLSKSVQDLLIYLAYIKQDLFRDCKVILELDNQLTNIDIIKELGKKGYLDSKRTAQEKVYAIKRLILMCKKYENHNPFIEYEEYITFLVKLQKHYFNLTDNKKNEPIPIERLKESMLHSSSDFDINFSKLYNDPIYSRNTSFSTVINQFAHEKYYKVLDKNYYYFKLSDLVLNKEENLHGN